MLKKYFDNKHNTKKLSIKDRNHSQEPPAKKPKNNISLAVDERLIEARLEISGQKERREQEKREQEIIDPNYDFSKYTFYDNSTMYKIKYITDEYVKQGQLNSAKIRKLLIHTIYDIVMTKLDKETDVNDFNRKNVKLFTKLFVRFKPVQDVVRDMTERVEMILRKELIHNREQLNAFINSNPSGEIKLSIVPPPERPKLPFDDLGKQKPVSARSQDKEKDKKRKEDEVGIAAMHFRQMKSGLDHIEKMMGTLENDNAQITYKIETVESEKKHYNSIDALPLEKLQNMLEDWDKQEISTKDELMDYAHELWKTASQFEKELRTSLKGHEMELKKVKFQAATNVEWIKHKTETYITVLEEALRMTKEKHIMEIENMNMKLSEFESRSLNQQIEEPELTEILTIDPNTISDPVQLKKLIQKLQKAGQSLKNQNKQFEFVISGQDSKITRLEGKVETLKTNYSCTSELKELYEGVISAMLCPPLKVTDTITFGKYRKISSENDPKSLLNFLSESGLKERIQKLSEFFIGLIDSLNDLKRVFDGIKMIPEKLIEIDPT